MFQVLGSIFRLYFVQHTITTPKITPYDILFIHNYNVDLITTLLIKHAYGL